MVRVISVQSLLKTTPKSALVAAFLLLAAACTSASDAPAPFRGPIEAGRLAEPKNLEASGLAASRRVDGLLWTHNDSGGVPVLFALGFDGSRRGAVRIEGVKNRDWEDIASFELDGKPWLLIADIGDNFAQNAQSVLHIIAEPDPQTLDPKRELNVKPAYSIQFIYEDGPRDCEAVAVDARDRVVYLLAKNDAPARLYKLPLQAATLLPAVARFVGTVPHLPQPEGWSQLLALPALAFAGRPTAMDFSPDGQTAVVLTYGGLFLFPRQGNEPWETTLAREPITLTNHQLPQAEAACFTRDGRLLFICSEKTTVLLRYDRRD